MKLLLLCALPTVAIAYTGEDDLQWEEFKDKYNKVYKDEAEESLRKDIFLDNLNFIREHNKNFSAGEVTFSVGVNNFADLTIHEFHEMMQCTLPESDKSSGDVYEFNETVTLPRFVDWREKGAVTRVKQQGHNCGSCWAFSATGSLEGQHFLKTRDLVELSEQNLVDCSRPEGNNGCHGGYPFRAFWYVMNNNGIDLETTYPYQAIDTLPCRYNPLYKGTTCSGYRPVRKGDELALQQAVALIGPISVNIHWYGANFQFYKDGVLQDIICRPGDEKKWNYHSVLVVGYGENLYGQDYWLVKNSWGPGWGNHGYFRIARNQHNMCGIASQAVFPTV